MMFHTFVRNVPTKKVTMRKQQHLEELESARKSVAPATILFVVNFGIMMGVALTTNNSYLALAVSFVLWGLSAEVLLWLQYKRKSRVIYHIADKAVLLTTITAGIYTWYALNDERWIGASLAGVFVVIYGWRVMLMTKDFIDKLFDDV